MGREKRKKSEENGKHENFKIEGTEEKEGGLKVEGRENRRIEWNRKRKDEK